MLCDCDYHNVHIANCQGVMGWQNKGALPEPPRCQWFLCFFLFHSGVFEQVGDSQIFVMERGRNKSEPWPGSSGWTVTSNPKLPKLVATTGRNKPQTLQFIWEIFKPTTTTPDNNHPNGSRVSSARPGLCTLRPTLRWVRFAAGIEVIPSMP